MVNKEKKEVTIWVEPATIRRYRGDDNVIGHSVSIPKGHKILSGSILEANHHKGIEVQDNKDFTEYSVVLLTYDPRSVIEEAEG